MVKYVFVKCRNARLWKIQEAGIFIILSHRSKDRKKMMYLVPLASFISGLLWRVPEVRASIWYLGSNRGRCITELRY